MHFVSLDTEWRVHAEQHPRRCNKRWPEEFKTEVINLFCVFKMTGNSFISVFSIWTLKYMLFLTSKKLCSSQLSLLHNGPCVMMYFPVLTLGLHRATFYLSGGKSYCTYYTVICCKQTVLFSLSCQRRDPV